MPEFTFRALEVHSVYAWDYDWVCRALRFIRDHDMTALVLHRNDIVDSMVYPGKFFGAAGERRNIFERYQDIHRALYRYTPTRRSGPYLRRDYLKRVIDLAARLGIEVWFENKELTFHDIFLELNPHLVKDGTICPNEPFWWDFVGAKYTELYQDLPGLAGIITAPGTGESRLAISSNRCRCELCRGSTVPDWYGKLIRAMHAPIVAGGGRLAVRDFVFDRAAQDALVQAIQALPNDIIISFKNTPHDYYPTFPDNPRLGDAGERPQWVEFDCMGQYFGWGIAPAVMIDDMRRRLAHAARLGAEGAIFRTDWESLDGHTVFHTPNLINLYAGAVLARDQDDEATPVYEAWLSEQAMLRADASPEERREAAAWAARLLGSSWDITRRALFTRDCVFTDATLFPVSLAHAWWLAEEKNSLKDWDESKAGALATTEENVGRILREKDEAAELLAALPELLDAPPAALTDAALADLRARVEVFGHYVHASQAIGHALILTRYALDHPSDTSPFHAEAATLRTAAMGMLLQLADRFAKLARSTDHGHAVYTLLSPERLRALYTDLAGAAA
jgi:hypothetical protein